MSPLDDLQQYSAFVYSLPEQYPFIERSTLSLGTIGPKLAKLEGGIEFAHGLRLDVWELLDFQAQRIRNYSYEVYRAGEKVLWYDPWEHPELPHLASTFPHHKHVPPDLRNNRVPAPGISFNAPNLPAILDEIKGLLPW